VLGPIIFFVFIGDISLASEKHSSYSALFADDLDDIFFFKKPERITQIINKYLSKLMVWLSSWRLKMNASKCMYTIFSGGRSGSIKLKLLLFREEIPYNPKPVFLGITFDESLCFNEHFLRLRARALKRLNIIKIFSHRSWHLSEKTLRNIYTALIGSLFDYSFFTVASVSNSSIKLVETIQNRAIRCIYRLKWDSPTKDLFNLSKILFIKDRFLQMGSRYITKCFKYKNKFTILLVEEYLGGWSAVTAKTHVTKTPLGAFYTVIRIAYACVVLIRLYLIIVFFNIRSFQRLKNLWFLGKIQHKKLIL
jgi:hypothetical protein